MMDIMIHTTRLMWDDFSERKKNGESMRTLVPFFRYILKKSLPLLKVFDFYRKDILKSIEMYEIRVAEDFEGNERDPMWESLDECRVWVSRCC